MNEQTTKQGQQRGALFVSASFTCSRLARVAFCALLVPFFTACGDTSNNNGYRAPSSADVQQGLATELEVTPSDNVLLEDISNKTRVTLQEEAPDIIDVNAVTLEDIQRRPEVDENDVDAICDITVQPGDSDDDQTLNSQINIRENVVICLEPGHYNAETILSGGWAGTPRKLIAKPSLDSPCDLNSNDTVTLDGLTIYADYITVERLIVDESSLELYGEENITSDLCHN